MNPLQTAREAVSILVGDGVEAQAHAFMPDRLVPPAVIVLPDSPYLSSGETFGTFNLGLEIVVVVNAKVNETGASNLDKLIVDSVVELVNAGISVAEVSEPWELTSSTGNYLAATITTAQPIRL